MNWQTLAILQTIPAAAQTLMMRHVARGRKKHNAAVINAISIVGLYMFGLMAVPALGAPSLSQAVAHVGWLVLGAAGFVATMICMYRALEHLAAGIFAILQTVATPLTIALAVPLLHESFQHYQVVGASLLMVTIWATLYLANCEDPHLEKTANWKKGVGYTLLSALALSIALVNEKHLLSSVSTSTYLTYGWGVQVIVAFLAAWGMGGKKDFAKILHNTATRNWVIGMSVARGLAAVLFVFAQVRSNNIALVSVVVNFKIIIIAVFGALVLKEHRFFVHKLTTAAMAVGSLALMVKR